MNRSLVRKINLPMLVATAVVGVLLIVVVPDRQLRELEQSTAAELESMGAAFAVSVQLAFEQQNLGSLADLSSLIKGDRRGLIAAVLLDSPDGPEVLGAFPEDVDILALMASRSDEFIDASVPVTVAGSPGRVLILSHRDALDARMRALTAPLYFAFLVIVLIQLLLYRLLSRQVVEPIIQASQVADQMGTGAYGTPQPKQLRRDEIGVLLESLRRLRTRLRLQNRQNRRLLGSLESAVEQRTQELWRALEAKDQFLAAVSHELRTPLHSIIASLDLLNTSNTLDHEEDRRYVRLARRGSVALMQLINELLDFQRLSQRDVILHEEPQALKQLVAESVETSALLFEESDIAFVTELDIPEELWVSIDGHRLTQILFNLISNARKFTQHGSVTVTVGVKQTTADQVVLGCRVADTGVGMDAATVERLGEAFFQAGGGLNRKFSGTGLGISIVKKILRAMDTQLVVDSQPGVGSTFAFDLRVHRMQSVATANPDTAESQQPSLLPSYSVDTQHNAAPQRILYVEDSDTNRQVMAALMARFNVELTLAESAEAGYALIQKQPFDVIVTDIQMPDHSGIDLLQWFQRHPGINVDVPVVACTANVTEEAQAKYEDLGFAGILIKPLTLDELREFLATRGIPT